jgi:HEAT repeat protein
MQVYALRTASGYSTTKVLILEHTMTQIDDLVKMNDRETLYELMTEDDEWLARLESAEGLIELGDRRGYEFLISVTMGDDDEMLEVANEILASPVAMKMKRQIE